MHTNLTKFSLLPLPTKDNSLVYIFPYVFVELELLYSDM